MSKEFRPTSPNWRWRTFPVVAALVAGLVIGSFVDGRPDSDLGVAVRIVALVGAAYVIIHLFVVNVIVAGRIRRQQKADDRDEASAVEEEYEDVVVHPDD